MSRGEDGLLTLIDQQQVPAVPHFENCINTWQELKWKLNDLLTCPHNHKTLVIDTLNGIERLIHEHECQTEYDGKWDKFDAYGRGYTACTQYYIELTKMLDALRSNGMAILCLLHSQVKTFQNPEGNNYDRWEPVLSKQAWSVFDRWFDAILFGQFETFQKTTSKDPGAKAKAVGGSTRIINTVRTAAFDAGNRHGLPEVIECGSNAETAWKNFSQAMRTAATKPQPTKE